MLRSMENIRGLMSVVIFGVLLNCLLSLALILFSVDQSDAIDFTIIFNLECLLTIIIICYIYSYFSETITINSFKIGEDVYDSLWYVMPMKQQKAMILIIAQSQKEFRLSALGMVDCSLEIFLAVIINLFSLKFRFKIY